MKKNTVFIFSYRLLDLRVLINTQIVNEICKKLNLVIITPKDLIEVISNKVPDNCILKELKTPVEKSGRNKNYDFKSKILNISRIIFGLTYAEKKNFPNCCSRKFQCNAFLNSRKKNKIKYIQGLIIILISFFLCKFKILRIIFKNILFLFLYNDYHHDLYQEFKPRLVIVGSSGLDSDGYILTESKLNKVKSLVINNSWDKIVCKGYPIIKSDFLLVWNDHMKSEAKNYLDYEEKQIFIEGAALWDFIFHKKNYIDKNNFAKSLNLDKNLPMIFYPMSSAFWHKDLLNTLSSIYDAKIKKTLRDDIQIIFRVHPYYWLDDKLREELFLELKKIEKIKGFYIDYNKVEIKKNSAAFLLKDDQVNMVNYYNHTDLLISVSSSTSIEMALNYKPSINIIYGEWIQKDRKHSIKEYDLHHLKTMNSYNAFINIYSFNELLNKINNFEDIKIPKNNFEKLINGETPFNRGTAYKKYSDKIIELSN